MEWHEYINNLGPVWMDKEQLSPPPTPRQLSLPPTPCSSYFASLSRTWPCCAVLGLAGGGHLLPPSPQRSTVAGELQALAMAPPPPLPDLAAAGTGRAPKPPCFLPHRGPCLPPPVRPFYTC